MVILLILGIVIAVGVLIVSSLLFTGVIHLGSNNKKDRKIKRSGESPESSKNQCGPNGDNFISPRPFKTGFIEKSPQPTANVCSRDDKFRYSINLPYVNYNLPEISDNCLCTEFIQAP